MLMAASKYSALLVLDLSNAIDMFNPEIPVNPHDKGQLKGQLHSSGSSFTSHLGYSGSLRGVMCPNSNI